MKGKVLHPVPHSLRAIEILKERLEKSETGEELAFPSRSSMPMTDIVLTKFLRDKKIESDTSRRLAITHGFRSSLLDWASESCYPRDLAERALAHAIKNAVEAAYDRRICWSSGGR